MKGKDILKALGPYALNTAAAFTGLPIGGSPAERMMGQLGSALHRDEDDEEKEARKRRRMIAQAIEEGE